MFYDVEGMDPDLLRKRVKLKLKERSLNVSQAEKLGGMKAGALRQFMIGRTSNPTLDTLRSIASVLSIEPSDLIKEEAEVEVNKLTLPWNFKIFQKIVTALAKLVEKNETSISNEEALSIMKNFYYSYLDNNEQNIDKAFASWFLNKMMGKK